MNKFSIAPVFIAFSMLMIAPRPATADGLRFAVSFSPEVEIAVQDGRLLLMISADNSADAAEPRFQVSDNVNTAQVFGMLGNTQNIRRTLGWAARLMFRKIRRLTEPPKSAIPMESVEGTKSIHTEPTVLITIDRIPAAAVHGSS